MFDIPDRHKDHSSVAERFLLLTWIQKDSTCLCFYNNVLFESKSLERINYLFSLGNIMKALLFTLLTFNHF